MIITFCILVFIIGAMRIGGNMNSHGDVGFSIAGDTLLMLMASGVLYGQVNP